MAMVFPPNDPISLWLRKKYPRRSFLDPSEVAANKHGEITPAQRASLKYELAQQSLTAVVFLVLGGGVALYLPVQVLMALLNSTLRIVPTVSPFEPILVLLLCVGSLAFGAIGIRQGIRLFRSFLTARREIANSHVAQADGVVKWTGDIYAAFVGKRRLKPIYTRLGLRPGKYHFYYLRQSRWLLSAEGLAIRDEFDSITEMQHILALTNRFSLEDLEANRKGYMTTRQRLRLWSPINLLPVLSSLIVIALFACALSPWLLLAFGVVAGWFLLRRAADMLSGQVSSIDSVSRRQKPQHRSDTHKYLFGNLRFAVSGQAYNALLVGQHYRVYYARYSKQLLSIEPLPDDAHLRA